MQLYGRTERTGFNEELSARESVTLTPDPTTAELALEAPKGEEFVELRLDPNDGLATFLLSGLRVIGADGIELYAWDSRAESLGDAADIRVAKDLGQVIVECLSADPFLLVPLTRPSRSVVLQVRVASRVANLAQEELADAVRSLQSSLRLAIDDLASEQEGLQDTLQLHQARGRTKEEEFGGQLTQVLDRTSALDERAAAVDASLNKLEATLAQTAREFDSNLAKNARETRESVLSEVRDDWRSLRHHMSDHAEAVLKQAREQEQAISAALQIEFAKLIQTVDRFAGWQDIMAELRHELHVLRYEDTVTKVKELKAEAAAARAKVAAMENSLVWRLTHPFKARTGSAPKA